MKKNTNHTEAAPTFAEKNAYIIILCLCVTAVFFIIHTFTGMWFWKGQNYNSYILQAQSWLHGRLDLGQNYSHLEIAIYNGKYYISFPPFPSYVMLPFVLFGWTTCDGIIAFAFSLAGAVYAYKILRHFNIEEKVSLFFALFLTVASNWLLTAQVAWVWFIAQNMAFTLSLMAIYYALKNKAGLSLFFWACSVGCRPFQALYIPVLLYLIYKAHKAENPDDNIIDIIKKRWTAAVPMLVIALSYMILNFARFGNITEFGHNYLPEHTESELGQFHYSYIPHNLGSLIRIPSVNSNGIWEYPRFNGMCYFMVSPIVTSYVVYLIYSAVTRKSSDIVLTVALPILVLIHLIALSAHVQMGGSHFGNRYPNDALPFIFLGLALILQNCKGKYYTLNYPLFFIGITLNVLGSVMYYLGY